jgi:PLP dependent protein
MNDGGMMDTLTEVIERNIGDIKERIERAAKSAGRSGASVHLVVVTKSQPVSVAEAAIAAGATILGENYPEETLPKILALGKPEGIGWHMIGHLQSRKAGIVSEHFDMLQSLDSLRLAEKLERRLAEQNRVLPVLLEMNVGGEESKFGWQAQEESQWEDLLPEIEQIAALPHIAIRGLMTMPPYYEDAERTRPFFVQLRKLSEWLNSRFPKATFSELSMGTSVDFEAAVQEGATYVRIGQAILGPRLG